MSPKSSLMSGEMSLESAFCSLNALKLAIHEMLHFLIK